MIIRAEQQSYWGDRHETESQAANQQRVLRRRRARPAPRCQGGAQDRAHARHSYLRLEERESRRREAVTELFRILARLTASAQEPYCKTRFVRGYRVQQSNDGGSACGARKLIDACLVNDETQFGGLLREDHLTTIRTGKGPSE